MHAYPYVWCGEYCVEFPAFLDHERVGSHVLHDLSRDLAAVGHARTLFLVEDNGETRFI